MSTTQRDSEAVNQSTSKRLGLVSTKEHKSVSTYQKQPVSCSQVSENNILSIALHPAAKYIGTPNLKPQQYKKFIHLLYYGLTYSVKNLKGPTDQYIRKKSVTLPQTELNDTVCLQMPKKKFLMLDLDETLIHSVFDSAMTADVRLVEGGNQFRFNVRPHCLQFLENMAQHYQIYVFTASTKDYAQPIVKYLNKKKRTINGILHRKNCLQTVNGFKIKDLRIIKNRSLDSIIIVDNLVHSFGLQLDNGIPIVEYIANKDDRELVHLEKVLHSAKDHKDVRDFIRNHVNIKKCLEVAEKDFLNVSDEKWGIRRESKTIKGSSEGMKEKLLSHEKSTLKSILTCGA